MASEAPRDPFEGIEGPTNRGLRKFNCNECYFETANSEDFKSHQCNSLVKIVLDPANLLTKDGKIAVEKEHVGPRKLYCEKCSFVTLSSEDFESHECNGFTVRILDQIPKVKYPWAVEEKQLKYYCEKCDKMNLEDSRTHTCHPKRPGKNQQTKNAKIAEKLKEKKERSEVQRSEYVGPRKLYCEKCSFVSSSAGDFESHECNGFVEKILDPVELFNDDEKSESESATKDLHEFHESDENRRKNFVAKSSDTSRSHNSLKTNDKIPWEKYPWAMEGAQKKFYCIKCDIFSSEDSETHECYIKSPKKNQEDNTKSPKRQQHKVRVSWPGMEPRGLQCTVKNVEQAVMTQPEIGESNRTNLPNENNDSLHQDEIHKGGSESSNVEDSKSNLNLYQDESHEGGSESSNVEDSKSNINLDVVMSPPRINNQGPIFSNDSIRNEVQPQIHPEIKREPEDPIEEGQLIIPEIPESCIEEEVPIADDNTQIFFADPLAENTVQVKEEPPEETMDEDPQGLLPRIENVFTGVGRLFKCKICKQDTIAKDVSDVTKALYDVTKFCQKCAKENIVKMIQCNFCNSRYSKRTKKEVIQMHYMKAHNYCFICKQKFDRFQDLFSHLALSHQMNINIEFNDLEGDKDSEGEVSETKTSNKTDFHQDVEIKTENEAMEIENTHEHPEAENEAFIVANTTESSNVKEEFECLFNKTCQFKTLDLIQLNAHMNRVHQFNLRDRSCHKRKVENVESPQRPEDKAKTNIKKVMTQKNKENPQTHFKCPKCNWLGYSFLDKEAHCYEAHLFCPFCQKEFLKPLALWRHTAFHHKRSLYSKKINNSFKELVKMDGKKDQSDVKDEPFSEHGYANEDKKKSCVFCLKCKVPILKSGNTPNDKFCIGCEKELKGENEYTNIISSEPYKEHSYSLVSKKVKCSPDEDQVAPCIKMCYTCMTEVQESEVTLHLASHLFCNICKAHFKKDPMWMKEHMDFFHGIHVNFFHIKLKCELWKGLISEQNSMVCTCKLCGMVTEDYFSYKKHIYEDHLSKLEDFIEGKMSCYFCKKKSPLVYRPRIFDCHENSATPCSFTSQFFTDYQCHLLSYHNLKLPCPLCKEAKKGPEKRIRRPESAASKRKSCPLCKKNFVTRSWTTLQYHFDYVHNPKVKLEKLTINGELCKICAHFSTTKENLYRHIKKMHLPSVILKRLE